MSTNDLVLRVVMEDAGCTTLTKECIENVLEVVKEGKYPKLEKDELDSLDESLARLIANSAIRDPDLAKVADTLGLNKTAEALLGEEGMQTVESPKETAKPAEREEVPSPTAKVERSYVETPHVRVPATQTIIRVKASKVPVLISIISLAVSLFIASLFLGLVTIPGVKVPSSQVIQKYDLKIKELQSQIAKLEKELNVRVNILEKKLAELSEKTNEISSDLRSSTTTLERKISDLKLKLKELSNKTDLLENALDNLQFRVKYLNETFSANLLSLKGDVKTLAAEVNSIKGEFSKLKENVTAVNSSVSALASEVKVLKESLNQYATKKEVETLLNELNGTRKSLEAINATITLLLKNLEANATRIDTLEKEVNDLSLVLTQVESSIRTLSNVTKRIAILETELKGLRKDISRIASNVTQIESRFEMKIENLNATYLKALKDLTSRIHMLKTEVKALQDELNSISSRLKEMLIKLLNDKEVIEKIATNLVERSNLDKLVAETLLRKGSAFYTLVQRIAMDVYFQLYQNGTAPKVLIPVG